MRFRFFLRVYKNNKVIAFHECRRKCSANDWANDYLDIMDTDCYLQCIVLEAKTLEKVLDVSFCKGKEIVDFYKLLENDKVQEIRCIYAI